MHARHPAACTARRYATSRDPRPTVQGGVLIAEIYQMWFEVKSWCKIRQLHASALNWSGPIKLASVERTSAAAIGPRVACVRLRSDGVGLDRTASVTVDMEYSAF